ncbi:MAG: hydrogenase nickel incorporation protein HypB [Erysipelotrichaceae bacterium]|nr:hydrogenase nickel incorporation protein HypB [Erysipelotrichaceae bacterium]
MEIINIKPASADFHEHAGEALRTFLADRDVLYLNLLSSPGAGKTTLLLKVLEKLKDEYRCGILEADQDSTVDALKLENAGYQTIQLHTGDINYLDASMSCQGLEGLDTANLDIVFLENIGNLVRPTGIDTGAHGDVLIFSIPEGADKPLKYPLMFQKSDLLVINKVDVLPYFDFDMNRFKASVQILNPGMQILEVSAKTGQGIEELANWIKTKFSSVTRK